MTVTTRYLLGGTVVALLAVGAAVYVVKNHPSALQTVHVTSQSTPDVTTQSALGVKAPSTSAAPSTSVAPPADCLLPGPPPAEPTGAVATKDDMALSRTVIQAFVQQLEAYQACRNNQADHAAPGVTQAQKDKWIEQGNDAVDEANALASAFSAQLQIYKTRHPEK
jgi:hypothetical protein